ncbi:MAG: ribbon-helix-helix domain-containing protein [Thermoplasmatota archaeon]
MADMKSVQVRFPPEELKRIDKLVKKGEYPSRSEFIRDAVRKAEMIRTLKDLRELMKDENVSPEDLIESGKETRDKIYKEMFEGNR